MSSINALTSALSDQDLDNLLRCDRFGDAGFSLEMV